MSRRNRKAKVQTAVDAAVRPNEDGKTVALDAESMDARALDAFQNLMARIGFGSNNLSEGAEYPLTRLTRDYQLITSLYRSHWLIRKIIDTLPEDMVKNWVSLTCQITPQAIDQFNKLVTKTKVKEMLLKGLKWGRLYGGAAGLILLDGHEDMLEEPLNIDMVMPGSFRGLLILDRWSGLSPTGETIEDINDPDFDLPEYYQISIAGTGGTLIKVHHSRILRFTGRDLPYWERWAENNWGLSEIEVVFDELKKRDNTSWNIASLIFLANIRVMKMNKLGSLLGAGNQQAQQQLYNTMSAQNQLMSNMGMMILDKDDDFDTKQYTFTGVSDVYREFKEDLSAASGYPVTKLWGTSPSGLNTDGESSLQNYDNLVEEQQGTYLKPNTDKLLPIICMSLWGMVPDDFDYKFNPVRSLSIDKLAEIVEKIVDAIIKAFDAGIISQKVSMKELRQLSEITGIFTNITDEDIEKAMDTVQQKFDLPIFGNGNEITKPEEV